MQTLATCFFPPDLALTIEFLARSQFGPDAVLAQYDSIEICSEVVNAMRRNMPGIVPLARAGSCIVELDTGPWRALYAQTMESAAAHRFNPTIQTMGRAFAELNRVHALIVAGLGRPVPWYRHDYFSRPDGSWSLRFDDHVVLEWEPIADMLRSLHHEDHDARSVSVQQLTLPESATMPAQGNFPGVLVNAGSAQPLYAVCTPTGLAEFVQDIGSKFVENVALLIRISCLFGDGIATAQREVRSARCVNLLSLMEKCEGCGWKSLALFRQSLERYRECVLRNPDLGEPLLQAFQSDCIMNFLNHWPSGFLEDHPECAPLYRGWMAKIAEDATLHVSTAIYPGASLGSKCRTGAHAVIRTGAKLGPGVAVPAGIIIEAGAKVRTLQSQSSLPAGTIVRGDLSIGSGVWIAEGVVFGAGCEVGDFAVIGKNVTLNAGVKVGAGVSIAESTVIEQNILVKRPVRANMHVTLDGVFDRPNGEFTVAPDQLHFFIEPTMQQASWHFVDQSPPTPRRPAKRRRIADMAARTDRDASPPLRPVPDRARHIADLKQTFIHYDFGKLPFALGESTRIAPLCLEQTSSTTQIAGRVRRPPPAETPSQPIHLPPMRSVEPPRVVPRAAATTGAPVVQGSYPVPDLVSRPDQAKAPVPWVRLRQDSGEAPARRPAPQPVPNRDAPGATIGPWRIPFAGLTTI